MYSDVGKEGVYMDGLLLSGVRIAAWDASLHFIGTYSTIRMR